MASLLTLVCALTIASQTSDLSTVPLCIAACNLRASCICGLSEAQSGNSNEHSRKSVHRMEEVISPYGGRLSTGMSLLIDRQTAKSLVSHLRPAGDTKDLPQYDVFRRGINVFILLSGFVICVNSVKIVIWFGQYMHTHA